MEKHLRDVGIHSAPNAQENRSPVGSNLSPDQRSLNLVGEQDSLTLVHRLHLAEQEPLPFTPLVGREKVLGKLHVSMLDAEFNAEEICHHRGRYEEALEWYGRALAGYENSLGKSTYQCLTRSTTQQKSTVIKAAMTRRSSGTGGR